MLANLIKKSNQNLSIFCAITYFFGASQLAQAEDPITEIAKQNLPNSAEISKPESDPLTATSNAKLFREIERSLIFSQQPAGNTQFYQQPSENKKSDIVIGRDDADNDKSKDKNSKKSNSEIDIIVVNPKIDDLDLRQKERLAYNSNAIDQYEVAITLYKEVISAEPDNSYAKFSLAVIYQKLGQFRQAKTLYYQLLKVAPEIYQEVITNLLTLLIEESPREAAYLLARLVNENPQSDYIAAQGAIAYERIKEYTRAITLMKKASELAPDNVLYKYNLAVMYDKAERYKDATEAYNLLLRDYRQENDTQHEVPIEQIQNRIKAIKNKEN